MIRIQKVKRILYWTAPSLLCLLFYWNALRSWFQMDDFAWLALRLRVHDFSSFLEAAFTPYAQGTIRFISERFYFMGLFSLFGLNALPFHIVVFLTQFANLVLITAIMRRLTASRFAAFAAPVLWVLNANINWPLTWTSAYNQVLCSLVLLLAFYLFLRYTETGFRKYYVWQWLVFVIGFGVLELVVLYPAIAALYALLRARSYLLHTLPMFVVSIGYALFHRSLRPPAETHVYDMFFDATMFQTFLTYCRWAFGAHGFGEGSVIGYPALAAILTALIAFIILRLRKSDWLPLLFAGWFLITLGPYLPLRNHISDYYLMVPTIGLAMLGGYALSFVRTSSVPIFAAAVALLLAYAIPSVAVGYETTKHNYLVSRRVRNLVERLAYAHKRHSGKAILINGVDSELFWAGFYDRPYQIFGLTDVFLTAETEPRIERLPGRSIARYFLADSLSYAGIRTGDILVYEVLGENLRNITPIYGGILGGREHRDLPRAIDAGAAMYGVHLREGWHPIDQNHRWMMKRASLEIGGPEGPGWLLKVKGFCPEELLHSRIPTLAVSIEGHAYPPSRVDVSSFSFSYPLPPGAEAKRILNVTLEVDKVFDVSPDPRELGLAFGTFEITNRK